MMNYDDRDKDIDDDIDNDGNEDGNDDDNTASGSGSDGQIFDPVMTPQSRGGGSGNDGNVDDDEGATAAAHYVSTSWTIYLPYKDHIKDVP